MRIGEAIGLACGDVDLNSGVVTIRHAQFDRTRLVPLHESTTALGVRTATTHLRVHHLQHSSAARTHVAPSDT